MRSPRSSSLRKKGNSARPGAFLEKQAAVFSRCRTRVLRQSVVRPPHLRPSFTHRYADNSVWWAVTKRDKTIVNSCPLVTVPLLSHAAHKHHKWLNTSNIDYRISVTKTDDSTGSNPVSATRIHHSAFGDGSRKGAPRRARGLELVETAKARR